MKISVTHSTIYRYDSPVILEPHIFRLQPRTHSAQRLLAFELQIAPLPAGTTECLDQDGNLALNAWFNAPTTESSISREHETGDHRGVRYRGLLKNANRVFATCALVNLFMVRKKPRHAIVT